MSREVLFDLDNNKKLEGNYFNCNVKLIDSVFALIENGYDVIDCKLDDENYIYLENVDVSVKKDGKTKEEIISEGRTNDEYRQITYEDNETIKYDSFIPSDTIEIKLLGNYSFSNIPSNFKIINLDNCTVIRVKINKQILEDNMYGYPRKLAKLDIYSTIKELESWIESNIGKKIEHKQVPQSSYGNSEFAIDYNTKQIMNGNYIALDPLMVPVISELRQKGYQTLGCCSGHYDGIFVQNTSIIPEGEIIPKKVESWVVFSNEGDVPIPPKDANAINVAKFFRVSYSHDLVEESGLYKPAMQVKEEIEDSMSKLLEWSKELPDVNKNKQM